MSPAPSSADPAASAVVPVVAATLTAQALASMGILTLPAIAPS